jgi:hypothetical protein
MEDPAKRRMEIIAEISSLGKQQKRTARGIISAGRRSPKGEIGYDERTQRIGELVLELCGLDGMRSAHSSETRSQRKETGTVRVSGLTGERL